MEALMTGLWPQRVDSLASRSAPSSSPPSTRSTSTEWRPSWLSKSAGTTDSNDSSRRQSSCTTRSSFSTSTASSASTRSSHHCNTYQLRESSSHLSSINNDTAESYQSALDATRVLASLAEDTLNIDEVGTPRSRYNDTLPHTRPDTSALRRIESRATSTMSKASLNPRDLPATSAEVEMCALEYHGYHRRSFAGALPAAAAICGTMLCLQDFLRISRARRSYQHAPHYATKRVPYGTASMRQRPRSRLCKDCTSMVWKLWLLHCGPV
ncbi:hypothetical protein DOTSEDRAFT_30647 [Dothistroma septosporum NZE10]|uniref:Uncharacterized protein n=1 Tax=Dothistroma septosporum (strain NZE10 / CBS 128990) TaxID=675120 RepID=N1Q151_DOTSN|nr:hypothetical protein DOTSEDRAFT_30647 [Dothistroma septosporum NZE10]